MAEYVNFRGRKNHDGWGRQPGKINVFGVIVKIFHSLLFCLLYILYFIIGNLVTLILIKYIKIVIIHTM